jgi:hypothetical protein
MDSVALGSDERCLKNPPGLGTPWVPCPTVPPTDGPDPGSAPTISGVPTEVAPVGVAYEFQPLADDADGDALRFWVSNLPPWAAFDALTGRLSGLPGAEDLGRWSDIVIGVTDGTAGAALAPFSVEVTEPDSPANRAPQIDGHPPADAWALQVYEFQPRAFDADGDTLLFEVTNLPPWASFDRRTGRLSGVPGIEAIGRYEDIVIRVHDGSISSALPLFAVDVRARPADNGTPVLEGAPTHVGWVGRDYVFAPSATDPDGDLLLFRVYNAPAWAVFDPWTGRLTGVPGPDSVGVFADVVIEVSDGLSRSALPPFSIDVRDGLDFAVLTWTAPTQNTDGTPLTDLAGFIVRYGNTPDLLDRAVQIPSSLITSAEIGSLWPGEWYFQVIAYNSAGAESSPSNLAGKYVH